MSIQPAVALTPGFVVRAVLWVLITVFSVIVSRTLQRVSLSVKFFMVLLSIAVAAAGALKLSQL